MPAACTHLPALLLRGIRRFGRLHRLLAADVCRSTAPAWRWQPWTSSSCAAAPPPTSWTSAATPARTRWGPELRWQGGLGRLHCCCWRGSGAAAAATAAAGGGLGRCRCCCRPRNRWQHCKHCRQVMPLLPQICRHRVAPLQVPPPFCASLLSLLAPPPPPPRWLPPSRF